MSRFSALGYELGRATRRCAVSGRELGVGESYVAALVEQPGAPKPVRVDFSIEAWHALPRPVGDDELIGSWRTHVHAEGEKSKPILDDAAMLELFESCGDEPSRASLRLVLALMLIRRRILSHEGTRAGCMLMRQRGIDRASAPIFEVKDPGVDEATISDVIAQIESLAGGGDA